MQHRQFLSSTRPHVRQANAVEGTLLLKKRQRLDLLQIVYGEYSLSASATTSEIEMEYGSDHGDSAKHLIDGFSSPHQPLPMAAYEIHLCCNSSVCTTKSEASHTCTGFHKARSGEQRDTNEQSHEQRCRCPSEWLPTLVEGGGVNPH
ncbi:uncharacterized protein LOC143034150 [Oratosquilla oratoria]|uniref:uncharacterized protein LOC143034150 n=1 Tax=Oratosquilla oratoria TaxID=337810 RepID=UPI003F75B621